jgi:hypothetical protein
VADTRLGLASFALINVSAVIGLVLGADVRRHQPLARFPVEL